ncbi:4'-phosphopantetheinyl transferase family protein [Luteococcus peritonei]|uniref:4'-phosphopantetheinyl transferase family protein n=1 Tax=Luteococcus peritonei TaxID=88874 RepID=A0ABW4RWX8_9ACTN
MSRTRVWLRTGPADEAHRMLLQLAGELAGGRPRLVHACPRCGSDAHGRPVLLGTERPARVSLARDRDQEIAVVAVSLTAAVGVDVEATGAADFPGFAQVALHPSEQADEVAERTRLWVRKEAALKARGTGLALDPRSLAVQQELGWLVDVDLGPGWSCAVAVGEGLSGTGPGAPEVVLG